MEEKTDKIEFISRIRNNAASYYVLIPAKVLHKTNLIQGDAVRVSLELIK